MKISTTQTMRLLAGLALVCLVLLLAPVAVSHAEGERQSGACSGVYYTVKPGDTWSIISRRVGVTVARLKQVNPQAVRRSNWVIIGERLCVPSTGGTHQAGATPGAAQQGGYWYQVMRGDTWNKVSRTTGVPVAELWAANPKAVNAEQWLYVGQRLWVPGVSDATTPAATTGAATSTPAALEVATTVPATAVTTPTLVATATATAEATVTPLAPAATPTPTAAPPQPTATAMISPLATPTPVPAVPATATPTATAQPLPPVPDDCPKALAGYGEAVLAYLNDGANTPETLQSWLAACRALAPDAQGVALAPITGAKSADVVVTITDPDAELLHPQGRLFVYHQGPEGYSLAHQVEGTGRIELLAAADINADKQFDLVYSDSTCGAHTCFATLSVMSWDGKAYADWIADEPTIAGPEYTIKDITAEGQGDEILVHGGVIGSVGAGPQRAWTETYISPKGAPYELLSRVNDASACLYHKILDANAAFDAWSLEGFDKAIKLYTAALEAKDSEACGVIEDEVATLQDFARFRLIVAAVAAGSAGDATTLVTQIKHPGLHEAATVFLISYKVNGSVIQACRDTTKLAESKPSTWDFLGDWGYANPSFTAGELCPLN